MAQRAYGVILILICALIVMMAAQGTTPEEKDISVVIFLFPLGIYAIFAKQKITYDISPEPQGSAPNAACMMQTVTSPLTQSGDGGGNIRYDEMLQIYPDIESLFSGVSDLVHDNDINSAMVSGWAERWISRHIAKEHQKGVTEKAHQFISAISYEDKAKGNIACNIQESFIKGRVRN